MASDSDVITYIGLTKKEAKKRARIEGYKGRNFRILYPDDAVTAEARPGRLTLYAEGDVIYDAYLDDWPAF